MLTKTLVKDAVDMTRQGASDTDLYTCLFVSEDDFLAWFSYGKDLVDEGYGRDTQQELNDNEDIDDFDILCLILYKGVVAARWEIKKEMYRMVSESENPQLAFKYLESVYQIDKGLSSGKDDDDDDDEAAVSFTMGQFYEQNKHLRNVETEEHKADENESEEETSNQTKAE